MRKQRKKLTDEHLIDVKSSWQKLREREHNNKNRAENILFLSVGLLILILIICILVAQYKLLSL